MTQERRERLEAAGIRVEEALERVMGSEALLERLLGRFSQDRNFSALEAALAAGDLEGAVAASHTLKGVCGNLSMTELYELFARQVEDLRQRDLDAARAVMGRICPAYAAVLSAIGESAADGTQ